ncbi:hypothetical protein BRD18_07475 [Halobacteriales archaeon SW_7_71_33]|nr:MAG: hypothetical protein BRD18_07475 [Halobacteriales archaeon SW_7_71_33]
MTRADDGAVSGERRSRATFVRPLARSARGAPTAQRPPSRDRATDTRRRPGPTATTETVARLATEMDTSVTLASALGCSVDAATNLHLAATLPEIAPCEIGSAAYLDLDRDPVDNHVPRRPEIPVPTDPGIGVEPDPDPFD